MTTVQRYNVILDIPDEPDIIQKYKDKGFNVIDPKTGQIIDRAVPHEAGALRAMLSELEQKLAQKEALIVELQKKLDELVANADETVETPKRTRKATK